MCEANIAHTAASQNRMNQYAIESGSLFKKTITQHMDGYSKPRWCVGTPLNSTHPANPAKSASPAAAQPPPGVLALATLHPVFQDQRRFYPFIMPLIIGDECCAS